MVECHKLVLVTNIFFLPFQPNLNYTIELNIEIGLQKGGQICILYHV